jgi:STE24 endopeptidase
MDIEAATQAYLKSIPATVRAQSDAYTEGGYWLILWGMVAAVLVTWILLRWKILERLSQRLNTRRPRPILSSFVVSAAFMVLSTALQWPWTIYTDWWRERSYGLSKQPFGDWFGQNLLSLVVSTLVVALIGMGLYRLIRRSPKRWWLWSGGAAALVTLVLMLLSPVFVEPLFNKFKPFPPGPVRDAIVAIAERGRVPSNRIFIYDGSRQRTVVTANVSGVLGTARIAVSDVALAETSLAEVRAVVGHEMGHYVLGHGYRIAGFVALLFMLGFYVTHRLYPAVVRIFGGSTAIADIREPAGMPVLFLVVTLVTTLATPLLNTFTRVAEHAADDYSLAVVGEPDGLSSALIKTVEYRKASPGRVEEFLFHSHPSVENRIRNAMRWKAAHEAR